ncbi:ARAP1 [Lepeophtheirus salmonis]|uniref:ARAP1 n=1 Tax=Lepeophtheirus salmonis TaxID=72036 RepID=A0A7R8HBB1_LEPSM|nr:ARAP1 [Lepeophtheirus salmonis]CAF2978822.1 ARAP1 [Lepeophtheirus salmonis]
MKSRQYEDIVIDKPKGHSKDDRLSLKSSYDEVSVNFGKPVIHGSKSESTSDCIFDSVTFQSPIEDLSPASREAVRQGIMPPVPAPRPSKLTQQSNEIYENVEILLQNQELLSKRIPRREEIYEDIDFPHRSPPSPPPRNTILIPEQPHLFNSTIPDDLSGAKPKHNHISKLKTIDIRNAVEQWRGECQKKNPAPTLLRDFDPVLEEVESVNNSLSSNSLVDIMKDPLKSEIEIIHNESENIYVACPRRIASSESLDLPAPLIPPPPLPELEPPPLPPNKPKTSESSTDILTEEEEVESKLRRLFKSEDKISTTSSSTTSSIDYESALKVSSESASHLPPQRSFSAANLNLTKMASHLKRKMSDRVFMRKSDSWRRSPLIESENSTTTGAKSHSGVLSLWSGNKKAYQPKCLLSGKYSTKTFGARTYHEREVWLERIVQSLNYKLSNHSMTQSTRLGWAYLKIGFAGTWNSTWISLANRSLSYFSLHEGMWEVMDLRKTKNISLKEGAEYLEPPFTSYPVLVIDFVDRSLYIAVNSKIELDQQMTLEEIPVIVDKCTKHIFFTWMFVRRDLSTVRSKNQIDRLLNEFKRNAWTVQISKNDYSEHDVANTLKRFMRTLEEPLLTEGLRGNWMKNSCTKDIIDKKKGYRALLRKLPVINYNTLRRLISHLSAIASQCDKNLMTNCNLASIGESDVCRDLIEHYSELFDVKPEELKRERLFTEVLTQISTNHDAGQHGHLKRSGDLRIWVYIDTKTSENCVGLVVQPSMKALEMTQRVLQKTQREGV